MSGESAVVLLSSGLDSTYNLYKALDRFRIACALTFHYGQKASERELARARELATQLGVPYKVVDVPWFRAFTSTALVGSDPLPQGDEVKISDLECSQKTAHSVWVPNRNGILLNIAAGFAEGLGASYVIPGFNREEAQTFPDNTGAFLKSLDVCWSFSTATHVKGFCFSTNMDKVEIVRESLRMKIPLHRLWPCYQLSETWCGVCESCLRFKRAIEANGLSFEELRVKSA